MRTMKIIVLIVFHVLILSACVSSGVEPNWDAGRNDSHEGREMMQASASGDYRVEVRRIGSGQDGSDAGEGVIRMESYRNGVRVGGGSTISSTQNRSRSHSTSFGVGRIGHPISIQAGRDSFVVVLEGTGDGLSARISQQSSPSLAQGHPQGDAISTHVMTPLGRWTALGGIDESSDNTSSGWQLGNSTSASGRQTVGRSQSALEIRVSPWRSSR
jgi:hypothetical protein